VSETREPHLDPRRWFTLVIAILSAFIVVLDNTVLNVAIPTIIRDLDTTLPAVQWVVTGYGLTFASLLIIGGRLGDVYGHRRIFIIGVALFGVGSLMAALSTSVTQLIVGEAIVEGIGASLMLPSTLAILSDTFRGRERATAFAAWGATAGVAAALGPLIGGFLTSNYSWRWSFGMNVIVAPLAILGALLFMKRARPAGVRVRVDVTGALMVSVGMFLLVFGLSEGTVYGWRSPLKDFDIAGATVWPASAPVSMVPIVFAAALALLAGFVFLERWKGRTQREVLVDFAHLRFRTYRYGILTAMALAMGQLGITFVLPVFLQNARHLTPASNGLWMAPGGLFIIAGSQLSGYFGRRHNTTRIVQIGMAIYLMGIVLILRSVSLDISAWSLLPGLMLYGVGLGLGVSQLTNVILSEIPQRSLGVASGANSTARQVGGALGVSIIGSIVTAQTIAAASSRISSAPLPSGVKQEALAGVHANSSGYSVPATFAPGDASVVRHAVENAVMAGTRWALLFAVVVIVAAALLSLLIPRNPAGAHQVESHVDVLAAARRV
jgi:EmrB/QacA subfamily drug resistance transporter